MSLIDSKSFGRSVTACGLVCLFAVSQLFNKRLDAGNSPLFREAPVAAVASFGHSEFGWSLVALQGLAHTVNAWSAKESGLENSIEKSHLQAKFEDFLEAMEPLSEAQLGMREIFTFPASYLAFERNELKEALRVAELGLNDSRLSADLSLVVAYLKHLFHPDLNEIAKAYENVLRVFPNAQWLNKTISSLRSGIDPMTQSGQQTCKNLLLVFPRAEQKLIERKVCPPPSKGVAQ